MSRERSKREHLIELLIRYPDTMPARGSGGFGGEGAVGMPAIWHTAPIQELERCLAMLRVTDDLARKHVLGRYCGSHVQLRARRKKTHLVGLPLRSQTLGEPMPTGERRHGYELVSVMILTWPAWVNPLVVDRGLDRLETTFNGEPMLPKAMVAA